MATHKNKLEEQLLHGCTQPLLLCKTTVKKICIEPGKPYAYQKL